MSRPAAQQEERVVLLDEQGRALGTAPKAEVHHRSTPLHLAFSCYVFDGDDRLLLTRRAGGKRTWPGVWTNSFCGHPGPGEDLLGAVRRRAADELGIGVTEVRLVLPRFRYVAEMADGTRENEMCPVLTARTDDPVRPSPEEVGEFAWVDWPSFASGVVSGARDVSPWCREQVEALLERERPDGGFRTAPEDALPEAARLGGSAAGRVR